MTYKNFIKPATKLSRLQMLGFAVIFGIIGTVIILTTQAASSSTISGVVFKDLNRNGIQDAGEVPIPNQIIYIYDGVTGVYKENVATDAAGAYTFMNLASGSYKLQYAPISWNNYKQNWVPTTFNGSIRPVTTITLDTAATVNFGIREIVRSTDKNAPISAYTGSNGLLVKSYDDVVPAKEVYDQLMKGSLVGKEAQYVTIRFDFATSGLTYSLAVRSNGVYIDYRATSDVTYGGWLYGDGELFHEYGHAWSGYYASIVQQDPSFTSYLQARGVYGDARLNTTYAWNTNEMIAEDYRELFGTPSAQADSQINRDIPLANAVSGLSGFLSGAFMQTPADTSAPTVPANLSGKAVSQSQVQLNWTASTDNKGVNKYHIFREGQEIGFVNAPATTFADSNLTPSTGYQYYVKAADAAGNLSSASATITVTTLPPDTQAPSAPTNLKVTSSTSTSLSLGWTASTDNVGVTEYWVYQVGGRKNTTQTLVGTTATTGFTIPNLSPNSSYFFYVVAVDAAKNVSPPSATLSAKTQR